ncbi:MAG: glycoside hydrolase family 5 [Gemmataceae bacterium]|nr:glycoside hydrolase family 5 [Gemmataceae bacterium]
MTRVPLCALVLLAVALPRWPVFPAAAETDPRAAAFAVNTALARGVNFGNALEAPKEGEWGLTLDPGYFKLVKDAGFQTVRVPVNWAAHAAKAPPYAIEPKFFERIDWVLDRAAANNLNVVLDVHHYGELDTDPDKHLPRLVALWEQIGARYKDRPPAVVFEMLNEPHDKLIDRKWNDTIPVVLKAIRATNPTRAVVVGPAYWNAIWALPKLTLPDDPNLILTVHYYDPFKFTHQGAEWASEDVRKLSGIKWSGTDAELKELRDRFDQTAKWAKDHNRPVFLGEFGAYHKADIDSRTKWTAAVVREAEARGFSWAYWEFGAGFGAYDRDAKAWREPLLRALTPKGK